MGPNRLVSLFVFSRLVGGGLLVLLFWRRRWRGLRRGVGRRGGLVGAYILGGCCCAVLGALDSATLKSRRHEIDLSCI